MAYRHHLFPRSTRLITIRSRITTSFHKQTAGRRPLQATLLILRRIIKVNRWDRPQIELAVLLRATQRMFRRTIPTP